VKTALNTTGLVLVALIVGVSVWDVFLLHDGIPANTVSTVLREWSHWVLVPYVCGVLAAHVFWHAPGRESPEQFAWKPVRLAVCIVLGVALGAWSWYSQDVVVTFLEQVPFLPFLFIGAPMGRWAWPQYADEVGA